MNYNLFVKKFYKDFQEYTFKNQVLIAASGFTIGITTSDFIKKLIDDIFKPIILSLFSYLIAKMPVTIKDHPILFDVIFKLTNFMSLVLIWIATIFIAFFVIEYILNRKIIGLSSVILDKEKDDFIKQKIESQSKNNIIPNNADIQELYDHDNIIEKYKKI
jgi:large-conductance mechanosensitive channel